MPLSKTALAVTLGASLLASAAVAEPKVLMLHQWATGADAAAIAKLGEMFTAAGGVWEQTAIAGHTANTLAKLRADVRRRQRARRPCSSRAPRSPSGTPPAAPPTSTSSPPPRAGTRSSRPSCCR